MALTNSKLYVRVEQIELGKNLMRFRVSEYEDKTQPALNFKTVVAPFTYTSNPFAEAYEFLLKNGYAGFKNDEIPEAKESVPEPVVVDVAEEPVKPTTKPTKSKKKATKE